jgi:hypothetical protein
MNKQMVESGLVKGEGQAHQFSQRGYVAQVADLTPMMQVMRDYGQQRINRRGAPQTRQADRWLNT